VSIETANAGGTDHRRTIAVARLTSLDLMFLRLENPAWPGHVGGLALVEGTPLLDTAGSCRCEISGSA
jgi:hypothetical protein